MGASRLIISGEERREVAAELRKAVQFDIDAGGIADPDDVYGAVGIYQDCGWFHATDVFRLADLIDRPTTTRHGKFRTKYGRETPCCEICGYSIGDMRWGYCPKCGAVITDD